MRLHLFSRTEAEEVILSTARASMPVAVLSRRMSAEDFILRLLHRMSGVSIDAMLTAVEDLEEAIAANKAKEELSELLIYIQDEKGAPPIRMGADIHTALKSAKDQHGVGLAIVDFDGELVSGLLIEDALRAVSESLNLTIILIKEDRNELCL